MGCYDDIILNCPKCGSRYYAQSKGGDCMMETYKLKDCPEDVLSDANRHAPYKCNKCKTVFEVDGRKTIISTIPEGQHHPNSFQGSGGL